MQIIRVVGLNQELNHQHQLREGPKNKVTHIKLYCSHLDNNKDLIPLPYCVRTVISQRRHFVRHAILFCVLVVSTWYMLILLWNITLNNRHSYYNCSLSNVIIILINAAGLYVLPAMFLFVIFARLLPILDIILCKYKMHLLNRLWNYNKWLQELD